MIRIILSFATFLVISSGVVAEGSAWQTINLGDVALEFPLSWRVYNKQELVTIQGWIEATNDDQQTRKVLAEKKTLLHAIAPNSIGFASVIISRSPPVRDLTSSSVRAASQAELNSYGKKMREGIDLGIAPAGLKMTRWDEVQRIQVGDKIALSLRYARSGPMGDVEVQQIQVPESLAFTTIVFSWRQSEATIWRPFIDRMRKSLRLN